MQSTPRGLATLALLKVRFDQGKDHLGLLEPFVADAVLHCGEEPFGTSSIVRVVRERSGLEIPSDLVKSVLGRFVKRSQLRREGGQYHQPAIPDPTLDAVREVQAQRTLELGRALSEFALSAGIHLEAEDALATLAQFISEHKEPLVLAEAIPLGLPAASPLNPKLERLIARFLSERCIGSPDLDTLLRELIEGLVIRDVLLLRDVNTIKERFVELVVVLDTPVLLSAMGLQGTANELATKEFLALCRAAGAVLVAYHNTVGEIRRILMAYETKLATAAGRMTLYHSELTHHVLVHHLTPSDIRQESALVERSLAQLGITVRELPSHEARFTLDENALASELADSSGQTDSPRVRHDVNVVAAVLTLRRGKRAVALGKARAVFCTTSGRVVKSVCRWYERQGEAGVPPIVHQHALSSVAWLKGRRIGSDLKLHELAAVCAAVLRPSRDTWDRFVLALDSLRHDGAISDDEAVAVLASELTEPLLARIDDSGEPDADTVAEVIERVKASYKAESERHADAKVRIAEEKVSSAESKALELRNRLDAAELRATNHGKRAGRAVATVLYWSLVALVAGAGLLAVLQPGPFDTPLLKVSAAFVSGGGILVCLYSQVRGPSLVDIRHRVGDAIARRVRDILIGHKTGQGTRE